MSILEFPIKRYQFTLVAFLCLVAMGIYAFISVPREEDPSFRISGFDIAAIMPGADPQDLERLVAKPLEDRLSELDDVRQLETVIADGVSFTIVEFEAYSDANKKYDEVLREVNALRPNLPAELRQISIRKFSPGLVNIVQYALVSAEAPYRELEDHARALKDVLKSVPGIRTSESWAYPPRELRIEVNMERLADFKLNAARVIQALDSENANIPAGIIDVGSRSFTVKSTGSYENLEQVRDTVVSAEGGRIVRVRDIAAVQWAEGQWGHVGRYNGQRAVFVTANMKEGQNILRVRKALGEAVARYQAGLPKRVQLELGFDQSRNVESRLDRLYIDFSIAIALVLITLLPLGLRAAGIVMISIPLSLAFGIAVLHFLGYSLNQLSIAGFVVALGLLVDDSIVAVENISRHVRLGYDRTRAAILGTRQIMLAVLGCTATLIFAFLPLMALPGTAGKFIRVLPTAVVATVVGSLLIALFIIPFLASRMLRDEDVGHSNRLLQRIMDAIHRYYRPALHYCLARPKATVVAAIGGSLLLSFLLVPVLGSSLFPKADTPQFLVQVDTPTGTSLAETDRALRFVEAELDKVPGVQSVFTNLGRGNPQIYYNHIQRNESAGYGEIFVTLESYDTRKTPELLDGLRTRLDQYPGARISVKEFINGPPVSAPIAIRVVGPDLQVLDQLAREVESLLDKTPGTRDVRNPLKFPRTNISLQADTQKAALLGVPAVEIDRAARLAISGLPAGTFKDDDGEQYPIVVRTPLDRRADFEALEAARAMSVTGELIPLKQVASVEMEPAPVLISRYLRERSVTVNAEVLRGENIGKVTDDVVKRLNELEWPRGYRYVLGGDAEAGADAFGGIGTAIIVAIFGIFAILVLEFGSFRSTLIVLTVVPLGVFGGMLMLLITDNDISFTAAIGFIALIGIEIKNSILLVDFTNQLREEGVPLDEAIEQAGEIRFLPILLTSATAIGGLLPLAVQNIGLYSPMAWVIIGGLITSTLLARLVTPVMYKLIPPAGHEPKNIARGNQPEASGALL
ncbi:MAG: efflux RND transporter permease subunit [Gammaproteobacteria bacterium]|nr:efflux RND transporter permease subunit [Gammaproteobacteria bacterium]